MIMRHRLARPSIHAPVSRGVETGRWRASGIILAMMAGLFVIVCAIEIFKG